MIPMTTDNEIYYLLRGRYIGNRFFGSLLDYTVGQPAQVEFDYKKVYRIEDNTHDVLGFYHTHPSGFTRYSDTDFETMNAWVSCLGKPLLCLIGCSEWNEGWRFSADAIYVANFYRVGRFVFGKVSNRCGII